MEDWAEIRRLHRAEGMAIRAIARRLGISRNTVKKALASHEPPRYVRAPAGSVVDAAEPRIRALLAEFPEMPTAVIMERNGQLRSSAALCANPASAPRSGSVTYVYGLAWVGARGCQAWRASGV